LSNLRRLPLGEILQLNRDEVVIEPDASYRTAGIYSFGRGVFERATIRGADTTYKSLFRLRTNQFVFSRLNGWEGAVDVVQERLDGCHVSSEYPTYAVDESQAEPRYLYWLCRWPAFWSLLVPRGSMVRRKRVQPSQLLQVEIPLPSIREQRLLAAKLDSVVASQIKLIRLGAHSADVASATAVSLASRSDLTDVLREAQGWARTSLAEVMGPAHEVVQVEAGTQYPNLGILNFGRGVFEKPPIDGSTTSARSLNRVRAGQFIYSRLFAFEGAYAYVPETFDRYFVSDEFPTLDPDPDCVDARWLASYLRSPARWAELRRASKGLGLRRQRVPVAALLEYEIWLPPIEEQRRMLSMIDSIEMLSEQRRRSMELADALLPSVLNEAFGSLP
jgi:type I restriction enzyme S subunit